MKLVICFLVVVVTLSVAQADPLKVKTLELNSSSILSDALNKAVNRIKDGIEENFGDVAERKEKIETISIPIFFQMNGYIAQGVLSIAEANNATVTTPSKKLNSKV